MRGMALPIINSANIYKTFFFPSSMHFRVKDMDIATGDILVVILNEHDAKKLDLHHEDRVKVRKGSKEAICVLDISESRKAVPPGSIGLFEEVLDKLGAKHNDKVELSFTPKPVSVSYIRAKLHGKQLSASQIDEIITDIVNDNLTAIEKTYFVAASFTHGLSTDETVYLTKAMVKSGTQLQFSGPVYDFHGIGGVPGNRTTMIVVPIVAAAGIRIPKTSSRAITSPSGTADTMEVLADVSPTKQKLKKIMKKVGACIVWGGAMEIAPADDKIIEVEHPLAIDAEGQMLASVMAKKAAVGATRLLLEIPYGPTTKAKTRKAASRLAAHFAQLGKKLGIQVKNFIVPGDQPVGNGIGPVLETRDVLNILQNKNEPADLKEKSLVMAGLLLEMAGKKNGYRLAKEILESGKAWKKMQEIINAQGAKTASSKISSLLGTFTFTQKAQKSGTVSAINNIAVSKTARAAGSPVDKGAGLYLHKKVGDSVTKGQPLFTIYAESAFKLGFAKETMKGMKVYKIKNLSR